MDIATAATDLLASIDPEGAGCCVGVARGGTTVLTTSAGLAEVGSSRPLTPTTVFDMASVSKQVTAAAVHRLAVEGRVDLAADVHTHLPWLPDYGAEVTITHLLGHTSGLADYMWPLMEAGAWVSHHVTHRQALAVMEDQADLDFAPGSAFAYSNSGYLLLGEVVASVCGTTYPRAAEDLLFTPLGMTATLFRDATDQPVSGLATAYKPGPDGEGWVVDVSQWESVGDGAAHSTVEDMLRWCRTFVPSTPEAEVVPPSRLELVWDGPVDVHHPGLGRSLGYAGGLFVVERDGRRIYCHGGDWAGWRSEVLYRPDDEVAVVVLGNAEQAVDVTGIAHTLADRVR